MVGGGPDNLWITSTCRIHHFSRTATFRAKVQLFFLLLNSFIVARKLEKMNSSQCACACNMKRFAHQMKLNGRQLFGKELSDTDWGELGENRGWEYVSRNRISVAYKASKFTYTKALLWLCCCMSPQFILLKLSFAPDE